MTGIRQQLCRGISRPSTRAVFVTLLALAILLPTWWLVSRWYQARLLDEQRAAAAVESSLRANALSSVINRRLARLQGLSAFVQVELAAEDFETPFVKFASGLYTGTVGIKSLAVAPAGVVRYVYPEQGNESLIGHEPLKDARPEVRAGIERAMESRKVVVLGPLEQAEGDQDLAAYQAVYQKDRFWGLVSMGLDMRTMMDEAEFGQIAGSLAFALRDGSGRVFYGSQDLFDRDPVLTAVEVQEELWELAGAPPTGWQTAAGAPLSVFRMGGLIIAGLLASLTYLSVSRQAHLAQAVRQRTREIAAVNVQLEQDIAERRRTEAALSEREAQYRSVFESVSDGLLIFNLEGRLVDWNPAAARMHGYPPEAFGRLQAESFVHPSSMIQFTEFLQMVRAGKLFRSRVVDLRSDGTPFHVQMLGTGFTYRGSPHALAVLRDITEEVQAYQLLEQRVEERTRELSTLLDASTHIASTLELQPLLEVILQKLGQVVRYDGACVLRPEGDNVYAVAHCGPIPLDSLSHLRFAREQADELWQALQRNEPLIIGDVRGDTWLAQALRQAMGESLDRELSYVRTWVGVPLIVQDQQIGWLSLHHSQPNAYTSHHANLAQTVANQAAVALENARLYEQARRLAALDERQRLARELHDSVSQALYGIGLGARTARTLLDRDPSAGDLRGALAEPLDYVLSLADAGLAEMRALIFELRPDALEKEGLVAALKRRATALRSRHGLDVDAWFCEEPELLFGTKEALYRIAQEGLNNVVKHAQASRLEIRLDSREEEVALEISDDGVGFDPETDYAGHMGLRSMQERASQAGAVLAIESSPGRGTRVRVLVPLPDSAQNDRAARA